MKSIRAIGSAVTVCCLAAALVFQAQKVAAKKVCRPGIYRTADDYKSGHIKLADKIDFSIHLNKSGMEQYLTTHIRDTVITTVRYPGGTVFMYRDNKGELFRYLNEDHYARLLSTEGIYLYCYTSGGKYPNDYYYFSTGASTPIFKLTRQNLTQAYAANASFLAQIAQLKRDSQLYKKNKKTGTYEVTRIFAESATPQ